jgi:CheY-like chemotaxis protein
VTVPQHANNQAIVLDCQEEQVIRKKKRQPIAVMKNSPDFSLKMILLVDDNDDHRVTTKWFLNNFGFAVDSVCTAEEALAVFDPKIHDVVVTDNSMPGMTGSEMAHIIKMRSPATPVVMYTGMPPQDQSCLDVVIQRPAHLLTLQEALDRVLTSSPPPASQSEPKA